MIIKDDYTALLPYLSVLDELKRKEQLEEFKRKRKQMTREEVRKIVFDKCKKLEGQECQHLVDMLEALGIIKFEEKKVAEAVSIIQLTPSGNVKWADLDVCKNVAEKFGAISVHQRPEGLCLWVGGRMVWQSWKDVDQRG